MTSNQNQNQNDSNTIQPNVIHSYSRKQAVEEGFQTCVSKLFPNESRMYKHPVYFTSSVWELCQENAVIVWDICFMSFFKVKRQNDDSSLIEFTVAVENAQRKPDFLEGDTPIYKLCIEIGAADIDDPTPAITIMFPEDR